MTKTYRDRRRTARDQDRREAAKLIVRADSAAVPRKPIKTRIADAAVFLGWPQSRVAGIWRRQATVIEAWEMEILRGLASRTPKSDT